MDSEPMTLRDILPKRRIHAKLRKLRKEINHKSMYNVCYSEYRHDGSLIHYKEKFASRLDALINARLQHLLNGRTRLNIRIEHVA